MHGANFTLAELLFGVRAQDMRHDIFHYGDPKLRGLPEKKFKVGYQYLDKPLQRDTEDWNRLAIYPTHQDRTDIIPKAAHKQACDLLRRLGMCEPPRDDDGVSEVFQKDPENVEESDGESDDEDGEDQEPGETQGDIDTTRARVNAVDILGVESNMINEDVRHAAAEAAYRAELSQKIDVLEDDAINFLQHMGDIEPFDFDLDFPPDYAYDPVTGRVSCPSILPLISTHFDPDKYVTIREGNDSAFRLATEKPKACETLSLDPDAEPTSQEANSFCKSVREVRAGKAERATRARTINYRIDRWIVKDGDIQEAQEEKVYIPARQERNVTEENALRPGSLVLMHAPKHGKTHASRFYIGKVIGVFWKSGATNGTHNRAEKLKTTQELSCLSLMVYDKLGGGDLFTLGQHDLRYTQGLEHHLIYHIGPADKNIRKYADNDSLFVLGEEAQYLWDSWATKEAGLAIDRADSAWRSTQRAQKAARKRGQNSKAQGAEEELVVE
ncbi:hypothetical protein QFC22_005494 [Naganishia vaughanmartiniae]|uniref:Uncharacterized protein n=1 Tax=Naganishia vaughanmartiniae TaxID=1424756 RepID=A0ACC2WT66_9TREE|nr:hypothetical protein QFC22_005494 [Naganishia vaughanmartiniae]